MLADFFDALMVAISMLFAREYTSDLRENILYDVREVLLRRIAEKSVSMSLNS